MVPPADPRAAAQELWGYFSQIDPQQRRDVMREIGHMMYENMTPEQREAMHQRWGDGRGRRDGQPGQPGPPMPGPPRQ
jgi:Spy/CpxP family protein refolding chaperone